MPLCQSQTPEGSRDCWGHMLALWAGSVTLWKRHIPGLCLVQLLQEKRLEPLGAQLGLSTGLPASVALAEKADVFGALWLGHEECTTFDVTACSSLSLRHSFGKLVLFARQPLVSSSGAPQSGICGLLRWDD